jgi:YidC/Oxa1 family membrane protein insertase
MDYKKIGLYLALVIAALFLWNAWQREFPPVVNTQSTPITIAAQVGNSSVPTVPSTSNTVIHPNSIPQSTNGKFIEVKTDVLDVLINTQGGTVEQAQLLQYPQQLNNPQTKVMLFNNDPTNYYVAQSGITGDNGPDTQKGQAIYTASQTLYELKDGQNEVVVPLTWQKNGVTITKSFTFTRNSYAIDLNYQIKNNSGAAWTGYAYTQLSRTEPTEHHSLLTNYATFTGAAMSTPQTQYQKLKFGNFSSDPVNLSATGGWAAMIQQYFLSAWVPPANQVNHYFTKTNNGIYTVGIMGPAITVSPQQITNTEDKLYVGPAIADNLDQLSPHLSMTIDYGWLWFISQLIFWMMKHIYTFVGNWGWSIILVTIVIKIIFYPLSNKSFYSMAQMRRLQPKIAQLKERFGDDRAGMSRAMMDMYKKEKVNPLSGCLPILVQIPVFFALYWVIVQSVELRQAPWIFWVHDLAVHDPYYILPVIMGGLMFLQQKMSPPPPDPTQAKVMMFLPVIFTVFFLGFPAGLVLYWVTNTLVTVLHQYYILRKVERMDTTKKISKV